MLQQRVPRQQAPRVRMQQTPQPWALQVRTPVQMRVQMLPSWTHWLGRLGRLAWVAGQVVP